MSIKSLFKTLNQSRVIFISLMLFLCVSWSYYVRVVKGIEVAYSYFYYIPIVVGAYSFGLLGGMVVAISTSLLYVAVILATGWTNAVAVDVLLTIGSFNFVGLLTGFLSSQSHQARLRLQDAYVHIITSLAQAIDAKDSYTANHSQRQADYAVEIAEEIGLSKHQIEVIRKAAHLHDLGKIAVDDAILSKPGKLTEEEWNKIKAHSVKGAKILEPLSFLKEVVELVRQHHERYDGTGYPNGDMKDSISLGARIVTVTDAYHAMTSDRPYRKAMSKEKAIEELKNCSGTQFDPKVVEAFLKVLRKKER